MIGSLRDRLCLRLDPPGAHRYTVTPFGDTIEVNVAHQADEAVTVRGSLHLVILTLSTLILAAPLASATSPAPFFERTFDDGDREVSVIRSELIEKGEPIQERCIRTVFCVGPIDPDLDFGWGATGFRLFLNDTNGTVRHDPTKHHEFGPYRFKDALLTDDLRVCWNTCTFPQLVYAYVHVDADLEIWVGGAKRFESGQTVEREVEPPFLLPRQFGCGQSDPPCGN